MTTLKINPWSLASVLVRPRCGSVELSSATAFVVKGRTRPILITNRHVVTGRDQLTRTQLWAATPDRVEILHVLDGQQSWGIRSERLYLDDGCSEPAWFEHPLGAVVDVVALPLANLEGVSPIFHEVSDDFDDLLATNMVRIIGFPFGRQPGLAAAAIWSTGFVASEPEMDWNALPVFLVDCRARPGQSGSPVVVWELGRSGWKGLKSGLTKAFLGVYSGRIHPDSDLGMVWKSKVVRDLIDIVP